MPRSLLLETRSEIRKPGHSTSENMESCCSGLCARADSILSAVVSPDAVLEVPWGRGKGGGLSLSLWPTGQLSIDIAEIKVGDQRYCPRGRLCIVDGNFLDRSFAVVEAKKKRKDGFCVELENRPKRKSRYCPDSTRTTCCLTQHAAVNNQLQLQPQYNHIWTY